MRDNVFMRNDPPVSILFAFNGNYAQHGAACIASVLRHTRSKLEIVVASTADPKSFAPELQQSFIGQDRLSLKFVHFKVPANAWFPTPYYITSDAYLRLWAHELFPDRSRILYLDPDIVVAGSIEELWQTDLQGKALGAVPIPNSSRPAQHGMPPGSLFFNSGVLLMDLDAWRSRGYNERCLELLARHPEKALDADQDILNLCLLGDWLPLDYKWNAINPFFRPTHDLGLSKQVIRRIRSEARIIHYNGKSKPWIYLDNHPRQRDYFVNMAETAWRDWRPSDRTLVNVCVKHAKPSAPAWLRKQVKVVARLAMTPARRATASA